MTRIETKLNSLNQIAKYISFNSGKEMSYDQLRRIIIQILDENFDDLTPHYCKTQFDIKKDPFIIKSFILNNEYLDIIFDENNFDDFLLVFLQQVNYEFCNRFGFDAIDLDDLFDRLNDLYKSSYGTFCINILAKIDNSEILYNNSSSENKIKRRKKEKINVKIH